MSQSKSKVVEYIEIKAVSIESDVIFKPLKTKGFHSSNPTPGYLFNRTRQQEKHAELFAERNPT